MLNWVQYVERDYEREIQDILDGYNVPEKKVKLDKPVEEKKEDGDKYSIRLK